MSKCITAILGLVVLVLTTALFTTRASATYPVLASPHKVTFSDELPDDTETYQSFHCDAGEALLSAVAFRQIGSSYAVPLGLLDYTASTYPEGVVVAMLNHTGHLEYYRVTLICAAVADL
jgi:hypothetical protein